MVFFEKTKKKKKKLGNIQCIMSSVNRKSMALFFNKKKCCKTQLFSGYVKHKIKKKRIAASFLFESFNHLHLYKRKKKRDKRLFFFLYLHNLI